MPHLFTFPNFSSATSVERWRRIGNDEKLLLLSSKFISCGHSISCLSSTSCHCIGNLINNMWVYWKILQYFLHSVLILFFNFFFIRLASRFHHAKFSYVLINNGMRRVYQKWNRQLGNWNTYECAPFSIHFSSGCGFRPKMRLRLPSANNNGFQDKYIMNEFQRNPEIKFLESLRMYFALVALLYFGHKNYFVSQQYPMDGRKYWLKPKL